MNTNLSLNISREDDGILVEMAGDLDISSSPEFTNMVVAEYDKENASMLFDMEDLNYIDSTGLGAFMTLYRKVKDTDFKINIINAKDNIKKIFTITELDTIFGME